MATKRRSEAIWIPDREAWSIRVQRDGTRKQFYSSIPGRRGKHDAEAKADAWLESGTDSMRALSAWEQYIEYERTNKSLSTYTQHERLGRLYIVPGIRLKKLEALTPATWQQCINAGAKAGLSKRTCVNIRATIVSFLKYCRQNRWQHERLEDGDLTIPNSAAPVKPKKALTDNDLQVLFNDGNIVHYGRSKLCHYIHAFRFMVLTGLRRGELAGLQRSDIDGNVLTISRSINCYNELTHGKNDNARRRFILTPSMMDILSEQLAYLDSIGIKSKWIFPDTYGERPDPNQIYDHWRTYCSQHGIKCSLHELRHTFISLTKSDLPIELMKSMIGHSSAMDTIGVYGHEVTGDDIRTAAIVENVMRNHLNIQDT